MSYLHLVSLNIERSKHLQRVLPFLTQQNADIVCIQELCEPDMAAFQKTLGMECILAPLKHNGQDGPLITEGIGIFSRLPVLSTQVEFYVGDEGTIPTFDWSSKEIKQMSERCALITLTVENDGKVFQIATTHFAWTPDGLPDAFQREALLELLKILSPKRDLILCGDFNAPRGGEIFTALTERYIDNIPEQYVTSLDRQLHRAGHLNRMVDGLFTTPKYKAEKAELVSGISDHCAIVADIS